MKKNNWQTINFNQSIREAMLYLNKIPIKTLLVLKNNKLIATLSDGDIRRGIQNGKELDSQISEVCNYNFKYIKSTNKKHNINKLFQSYNVPLIPILNNNKKIVEVISEDSLKEKKINKENFVFILAGGEGKRLSPLTKDLPKPILKVGKLSIIELIFSFFRSSGFNNFVISINYKKTQFKNFLRNLPNISYQTIEEKRKLGTAGSLGFLKNVKKPFFIINGDIICNTNYENLMNFHIKNKAKLTIVTRRVEKKSQFGVIELKKNNLVKNITEKPTKYDFINTGIYVADPIILKHIKKNIKLDMPDLIRLLIKKRLKVLSYEIYDYWRDIGTLENLNEVRSAISHMIK